MKKQTILLTALLTIAAFIGVSSCCKKNTPPVVVDPCTYSTDFVNLNIPFTQSGASVIPAIVNLAPTGLYIDSLFGSKAASTVESQVQSNGTYKTCQTSFINVTQLRVIIDSPSNQNFDFIDSINLFIRKKDGTSPLLIAKKGALTPGSKQIIMDIIPNADIKSYVIADSFAFSLGVRKSAMPIANTTDPTYLRFDAGFNAKIFTK